MRAESLELTLVHSSRAAQWVGKGSLYMSQLLQVSAGQLNCSESVSQSPFCLYKLGMAADVFSPIATDSAQF